MEERQECTIILQWDVHHGFQVNGKVYVNNHRSDIQVYEYQKNKWSLHCKAPDKLNNFAMTVLNGQLVLAGGERREHKYSKSLTVVKEVAVWNSSLKVWEYPYPPMPKARHSALLISYLHYLIAVGGSDISRSIGSVEILDTSRSQWHIAEPLPKPSSLKQSACVLDTLYVLGSSSHLFRASISMLVSRATSKRKSSTPTWEMLPDIPFQCSGLVAYENSLITIDSSTVIPGIHVYNADTNEWTRRGDLPTTLCVKLCVKLLNYALCYLLKSSSFLGKMKYTEHKIPFSIKTNFPTCYTLPKQNMMLKSFFYSVVAYNRLSIFLVGRIYTII